MRKVTTEQVKEAAMRGFAPSNNYNSITEDQFDDWLDEVLENHDTVEGTDGLTDHERNKMARERRLKNVKPLTKEEKRLRLKWILSEKG